MKVQKNVHSFTCPIIYISFIYTHVCLKCVCPPPLFKKLKTRKGIAPCFFRPYNVLLFITLYSPHIFSLNTHTLSLSLSYTPTTQNVITNGSKVCLESPVGGRIKEQGRLNHLQIKIINSPLGTRKCNFPPFCEIMTVRPTKQPTNRRA